MRLMMLVEFSAIILLVLNCCQLADAQSLDPVVEKLSKEHQARVTFLNPEYLVFAPGEVKLDQKIPLFIYLHGGGGVGDDATKNTSRARVLIKGLHQFDKGPVLVVAPQCKRTSPNTDQRGTWIPKDLEVFLQHVMATHLDIDTNRVYLTGNSMGGYGCWVWGGHYPEHFAAIAPIVGGILVTWGSWRTVLSEEGGQRMGRRIWKSGPPTWPMCRFMPLPGRKTRSCQRSDRSGWSPPSARPVARGQRSRSIWKKVTVPRRLSSPARITSTGCFPSSFLREATELFFPSFADSLEMS